MTPEQEAAMKAAMGSKKENAPVKSEEKPEPKVVPFSFNETSFEARVNEFKKLRTEQAGKADHNPFLWYNKYIQPLVDRYNRDERSVELYKSLMAIELVIPPLKPAL